MNNNPLQKAVKTAIFASAAMMMVVPATYAADESVEEVVVTGSRITRPDLDAVSPFSVVSGEEFKISGNLNVEQKLAELPNTLPSFGPSSNNPGDGTARVDLRGLGTSRTLVLVNGRRYIPSTQAGVVDLNTIPGTLIKQVDVLTGGASAVYGSDALAGVVNFQLVDDFEGAEITGLYDITTEGDAEKFNTDLTIGGNFAEGRGNAVAYASYSNRKALFQGDRSFSDVALTESDSDDDDINDVLVAGGSSGIPGTRLFGGNTANPDGIVGNGDEFTLGRFLPDGTGATFTGADRFNYAPDNFLQLPQERLLLSTSAHFDLTPTTRLYSELTFARNKVPQELAPTPAFVGNLQINPNSAFFDDSIRSSFFNYDDYNKDGVTDAADVAEREADGLQENIDQMDPNFEDFDPDYVDYVVGESQRERDEALGIYNPTMDNNDDGVIDADDIIEGVDTNRDGVFDDQDDVFLSFVGRRMVENGSRQAIDTRNALRLLVGLKGDLSDNWTYDAYYSRANLDQSNLLNNDVAESRFRQAILVTDDGTACQDTSGGCAPLNIFGAGNISPEAINFINVGASNVTSIKQEVIQASVAGDFGYSLPSTDLPIAAVFGYEHRNDNSSFRPDEFLAGGDILGFNAGLPTIGSFSVGEFFGEVSVPLYADKLDFWAAARNSNYSTAVSSVNSFATALNWTVNDYAKVRVGFQSAVRAPNVAELFGGTANGFPGADDPCSDEIVADTNTALCVLSGVSAGDVGVFEQANTQIESTFGGNVNLKEEESDTFTIGAVITPLDGLDITVDYYNIEIADPIGVIGTQNLLNLCFNDPAATDLSSFACQQISRRADGNVDNVTNLNTNTGNIETSGIDLNVNYNTDLNFGINNSSNLNLEFKSTFLSEFDLVPFTGADFVNECAGSFGATCGSPLTETLWNVRATLETGEWTFSSLLRYIGEATDDQITTGSKVDPSTIVVPTVSEEYYLDISARYTFSEEFSVNFGINNILDTKPTRLGDSQEQANTFPSTYDLFGPRAFVSASYKFF